MKTPVVAALCSHARRSGSVLPPRELTWLAVLAPLLVRAYRKAVAR